MAGAAVGATVALDALFGGPISSASMNPARSRAPAIVGTGLDALWDFFAGPLAGAALAVAAAQAGLCRETLSTGLRVRGQNPGAPAPAGLQGHSGIPCRSL
jgi:hypothetical protein